MHCTTCDNLKSRVQAMTARFAKNKSWRTKEDQRIMLYGYGLLVKNIQIHFNETDHEVDFLELMKEATRTLD